MKILMYYNIENKENWPETFKSNRSFAWALKVLKENLSSDVNKMPQMGRGITDLTKIVKRNIDWMQYQ